MCGCVNTSKYCEVKKNSVCPSQDIKYQPIVLSACPSTDRTSIYIEVPV